MELNDQTIPLLVFIVLAGGAAIGTIRRLVRERDAARHRAGD